MDVPRKDAGRKRLIRRIVWGSLIVITVPLISWGLKRLKPAAPTVEGATVWKDVVKRGPMRVDHRGLGTLVPEETLLVPATTNGRVDKRLVLAGTLIQPDTILFELSNPELQTDMLQAEYQLKSAEAHYTDLKVSLESHGLDQKALAAQVTSDYNVAKLQADRDNELVKEGLIPDLTMKLSAVKAQELSTRTKIEEQRLASAQEGLEAQLAVQRVEIDRLRAMYQLKKSQVDALKVRSGIRGIMQQLLVEVGQQVTAGFALCKVTQPEKLKAELKIAETQAKDIQIGQNASIDTRNGIIPGKVSRIDPASINGTVTVDVKLMGALPTGARPDLSVDGSVEIENLADVVYVGRPVFGQPNSTITLFKLEADGQHASRTKVTLGRASVNNIEIVDGLKVGDTVILSDMSAQDLHDRIRLN
jgi:HlyD family secretion protein